MGIFRALGAWLGGSDDTGYTPLSSSPDHKDGGISKREHAGPKKAGDRRILKFLSMIAGGLLTLTLILALG